MDRRSVGMRGEELAARHLEEQGWTVLARNYRAGHKEVDVVARRGRIVAFVEVKTRTGEGFGHPLEAITRRKRREIEACARAWSAENGWAATMRRRFDAVAVRLRAALPPEIEHVEDAWRMVKRGG